MFCSIRFESICFSSFKDFSQFLLNVFRFAQNKEIHVIRNIREEVINGRHSVESDSINDHIIFWFIGKQHCDFLKTCRRVKNRPVLQPNASQLLVFFNFVCHFFMLMVKIKVNSEFVLASNMLDWLSCHNDDISSRNYLSFNFGIYPTLRRQWQRMQVLPLSCWIFLQRF